MDDRGAARFGRLAAAEQTAGHYDALVTWADAGLGRVIDALERRGLADDSVVVVTSNHGEHLYERGVIGHGLQVQPDLRVPLVIADPGAPRSGQEVDAEVQSIDLEATLLDRACIPADQGADGVSLLPLLGYPGEPLPGDRPILSLTNHFQGSLLRGGDKLLVWNPRDPSNRACEAGNCAGRSDQMRYELYDLAADPGELFERSAAAPDLFADLKATLDAWMAERLDRSRGAEVLRIDDALRGEIKARGYWEIVNPSGGAGPRSGRR